MEIYSTFVDFYDKLMDKTVYEDWLSSYQTYINQPNKTLDLACGSGTLTLMLAQYGIDIEGVDLSDKMLKVARKSADDMNLTVPFIKADITDLSNLGMYQNIISSLDSLCYLPNCEMLAKTFHEVYAHLNEGGIFMFDVISPLKIMDYYDDYMYNYVDDNEAFIWHSQVSDNYAVEHDLTFFLKNESNHYERYQETHYERTYELSTYKKLLHQVGFSDVQVGDEFSLNYPVDEQSLRWFFVCQK